MVGLQLVDICVKTKDQFMVSKTPDRNCQPFSVAKILGDVGARSFWDSLTVLGSHFFGGQGILQGPRHSSIASGILWRI